VLNIAVDQMMDRATPKTPFEIELDMIYLKYIDLDTLNSIRGSPAKNFDGIDYKTGRDRKIFLEHAFADFSK
jgi:hypothetical protein